MFDGAAFCPKCGARRERVEADASGARCPSCRNELQHVALGAASLLECTGCDGVWLDAADFEGVCADREARAAVLHRWTSGPAAAAGAQAVRYRPCVRCGKMMNRVNFGKLSGTVVDVCRGHGTFVDAGELHAIVTFVESGGIDRMRQRQIEELKDEQRRLRDLQMAEARSAPVHNGIAFSGGTWGAEELLALINSLKK